MKWLNTNIEIQTDSMIFAIFLFSLLSGFCSTIIILIYLNMKQLRTAIYHFFFHVAINELLSRITYFIRLFTRQQILFIYKATTFITYLVDTNIIILVAFTCFGMYLLILKQNTKLASQFHKISIFLYVASLIITIIFFVLSINDEDPTKQRRDADLYRNIITLLFITDEIVGNLKPILFSCIIYFIICFFSLIIIILIQFFIKDRASISSSVGDDETVENDKKITSSLKLRTFSVKLFAYPFLNFAYVIPLFAYTWVEYAYLTNMKYFEEKIMYLRIRFSFFNAYCFMNSIRGFLFFLVFIMNEKIKKFLFQNYLNFEIFKTIDKIEQEEKFREGSSSSSSIESSQSNSYDKEMSFNNDEKEDLDLKNIERKRSKDKGKKGKENESGKRDNLIEMDPKQSPNKLGLINDEDNESDSDEESSKPGRDAKSDTMAAKKIKF